MAKPSTKKDTGTKVTRIKSTESPVASKASTAKVKTTKVKPAIDTKKHLKEAKQLKREKLRNNNPFKPILVYLKGSWEELKQVRWPDRRSTWGMTGALLMFTLFFTVLLLSFDFIFSELFKLILGSN